MFGDRPREEEKNVCLIHNELNQNTIRECLFCSFLIGVARSHIHIFICTVQLRVKTRRKKKQNRSVCMSSLLEFILGVDRQSDKHTVSEYDV